MRFFYCQMLQRLFSKSQNINRFKLNLTPAYRTNILLTKSAPITTTLLSSHYRLLHRHTRNQLPDEWTGQEDLALQIAVQKYGTNWSKIQQMIPEKSALQCKSRWKILLQTWRRETPEDKERRLKGSKQLVLLAMGSNFTVCLSKLGGALYIGSASLFAESIHSLMDMINQGLLFIGIQRSLRHPNIEHPYGFHKEQYAWAIISAVGILFIGGGVPIYHGIENILHASSAIDWHHLQIGYGVLSLALFCEGFTATKAYFRVRHLADKTGVSVQEYLFNGSDPSSVQVLLEDSSSVLGTLIAGTSLTLSYLYQSSMVDAFGSCLIGGLLSSVAVFLLRRNIKMILEHSMSPEKVQLVTKVIATDPVVSNIQDIKTHAIGPEHARFKAEISFNSEELTKRYLEMKEIHLDKELKEIQSFQNPKELETYLIKFSNGVVEQLGDEIDRIEDNIKDVVPEVKHVDLEVL